MKKGVHLGITKNLSHFFIKKKMQISIFFKSAINQLKNADSNDISYISYACFFFL